MPRIYVAVGLLYTSVMRYNRGEGNMVSWIICWLVCYINIKVNRVLGIWYVNEIYPGSYEQSEI